MHRIICFDVCTQIIIMNLVHIFVCIGRYVFAVGAIGFLYNLIQLPFAMYNVVQKKRMIRNGCLPEFDYFGDKVQIK